MDKTIVNKDLKNSTLTIERVFDASKEVLWRFYADKESFEKWWGPEGWQTSTKEFNFASGGRVHYGMKCIDERQTDWFGRSSWGVMRIESVEAPNSFTYKDYFADEAGVLNPDMPALRVITNLIEEGSKTRLVSVSFAESPEQIEELLKMGVVEGFSSQMDKLDTLV